MALREVDAARAARLPVAPEEIARVLGGGLVEGSVVLLGGELVDVLLAQGHAVRALTRPSSNTTALQTKPVDIVAADATDTHALATAVAGVDIVFHIAAYLTADAPFGADLGTADTAMGGDALADVFDVGGPDHQSPADGMWPDQAGDVDEATEQRLLALAEPVIILLIAVFITVIILAIVMAVIDTTSLDH